MCDEAKLKRNKHKRNKNFYIPTSKRRKRTYVLEPGLKGFIVTCNREREAIREAYDLLNEFGDKIYGKEDLDFTHSSGDIDDAAKNELESLEKQRRFQVVESGVNNCLFIKTQIDDPTKLVYAILDDIEQKAIQRTKFLLRMMPVIITCKAYISDITKATDSLLTDFFEKEGNSYPTYAITFKHRYNNQMKREQLLPALIQLIESKKLHSTADLKNPSIVLNVEIIRSICCLSLLKDYYKYKRYNLVEYALKVKGEQNVSETASVNADSNKNVENMVKSELNVGAEKDSDESKIEVKEKNGNHVESVVTTEEEIETNDDKSCKITETDQ